MEFFINHTRKQIEFAGENAHYNNFLVTLSRLVDTKGWTFKDDIQIYIDQYDDDSVRIEILNFIDYKEYSMSEEYYYIFFREGEAIEELYDRELERDTLKYGDGSWQGWDSDGASFDT